MPITTVSKPYTAANAKSPNSAWKYFPQRSGATESHVFAVVDQPLIITSAGLAGEDVIALQVTPDGVNFSDFYLHDVPVQLTPTNVIIVLKVPGVYRLRKVTGAASAVVTGAPNTMTHEPRIPLTLPHAGATGPTGATGPAGSFGGIALIGELRGADFAITTDQPIDILASRYLIDSIIVNNRSNNTGSGEGGFYTSPNKLGDVLVEPSQIYPAGEPYENTFATLAAAAAYVREEAIIYLSLSVQPEEPLSADVFIYGYIFDA